MARWIDVPAHRVLEIPADEFDKDYILLNTEGHTLQFGQQCYRVERKSDNRLFRLPRYHYEKADLGRLVYLEEI